MIVQQLARALIEELDALSRGTVPRRVPVGQTSRPDAETTAGVLSRGTVPSTVPVGQSQLACPAGTMGIHGTLGTGGTVGTHGTAPSALAVSNLSPDALADLIVAYEERLAMVLEGGDIAEPEAHRIATVECGASLCELQARLAAIVTTGDVHACNQNQAARPA